MTRDWKYITPLFYNPPLNLVFSLWVSENICQESGEDFLNYILAQLVQSGLVYQTCLYSLADLSTQRTIIADLQPASQCYFP